MVQLGLFDRALGSRRMPYGSTGNLANGMEDKEWEKEATSSAQCILKFFLEHFTVLLVLVSYLY